MLARTQVIIGVVLLSASSVSFAQQKVVIRGGTLIDRNGGTPVQNSTVVIEGDRIKEVRSYENFQNFLVMNPEPLPPRENFGKSNEVSLLVKFR